MEYRSLNISHLEKLESLEKQSFSDPWSEKMLRDSLESKYTAGIGAFEGEELVGYVMWLEAIDCFEILNVATLPSHRRRGIGKKLMRLCIGYAESLKKERILLEVRRTNTAATALYESLGFLSVGVRKNYYKNPVEDAILMDLALEIPTNPSE